MLAGTVAPGPSIILADEPGASLDIRHRLDLVHRLRRLSREAVVVVIMHGLDLAASFCDRIVVMNDGTVVADGEASAIIAGDALGGAFRVRFQRTALASDADWLIGTTQDGS